MNPNTQTAPQVTTVQSSTNYGAFSFLNANRAVSERHVGAIKRSFEDNGNFTQAQPILVNEQLQIIDGQHRFTAARELGVPIFYTVVPGLGAKQAREMNLLHREWEAEDYLRAYANDGQRPYILFQELQGEYPGISLTTLITYVAGAQINGIHKKFRDGRLKLTATTMDKARRRLNRLVELRALTDAFKRQPMAMALLRVMATEYYKHSKMVRKVENQRSEIRAYQSMADNVRQLEDVFNKNSARINHVRFF